MKKNLFNTVQIKKPSRSYFDLSHDVKMSGNMGQLLPVFIQDCLPGDVFNISHQALIRFAPMVAPVMHRFDSYVHYFFVPNRILWDNWEEYITNQSDPAPAFPYFLVKGDGSNYNRLMDYFGIPIPGIQTPGTADERVSCLPFMAYATIWNEYYRDQNLQTAIDTALVNGLNPDLAFTLLGRAWEHDYLTSALPFAQKGEPVDVPLGEVELNPDWDILGNEPVFKNGMGVPTAGGLINQNVPPQIEAGGGPGTPVAFDPNGSLQVGATTINELRLAYRLQEYLEINARVGTRYNEFLQGQYGVKSSDARLQRPEYICGSKTPVTISEVLQTSATDDVVTPQGNMAGHGVSFADSRKGKYYCEEHGYIIGIMSVMPKTAYQQGLPKHLTKVNDALEFALPVFANIGEQEIKQREVMAFNLEGDDTFGYIPRYAEYKYNNSRVCGEFRTSLNYWHAGRIFGAAGSVPLNGSFIQCDATKRIFAVEDPGVDNLYIHFYNQIGAVRKLPRFGTPMGLI